MCAPLQVIDASITATPSGSSTYEAPDIGILPSSIRITGNDSALCQNVRVVPSTHLDGWANSSGIVQHDQFELGLMGGCSTFTASYTYTNCSLTGDARFSCPMDGDPTLDGYCKFFMLYEGVSTNSSGFEEHNLLLAHSQEMDSEWAPYLPSGNTYPSSGDVAIGNTGQHKDTSSAGDFSWAGVPDLIWDPDKDLWRVFFVSEDYELPNVRISESEDDGLTWGLNSAYSQPIDCWDSTASTPAYDPDACASLEWDGASQYPPTPSYKDTYPYVLDPDVYLLDADGDGYDELGMLFGGGDDSCNTSCTDDTGVTTDHENEALIILFQFHKNYGYQGGSDAWFWEESTAASVMDTGIGSGLVLDEDYSTCEMNHDADCDDDRDNEIADPTVVRIAADKYLLFYLMNGHIYLSASGFECSDMQANDTDSLDDFGQDPDCLSPADDSE